MTESMEEQVQAALRRVPGVAAVHIVSADGPAGSATTDAAGEAQGALLAALVGALRQASDDLALGEVDEILVDAGNGAIMAGALPQGKTAVVIAGAGANLGMVRIELRRLRRHR